jgi:DNA-binding response OmpR family regulator
MRILIIEDNVKLANSLKKDLSEEGFVADCLHDGEEGFKRLLDAPEARAAEAEAQRLKE